jgi:signal transduction histidine kinase
MGPIDAGRLVGALVEQMRPVAADKSVGLEESLPAGLTLRGDMDLLIRLFLNLLDNAVKYTPEGGRVSILAARNGQFVEVAIRDTGPGVPPEHLQHLFERFYRVEDHRARAAPDGEQGGAGLGLAIAWEIARAHGGGLEVKSEPGRGSTFTVRLPAAGPDGLPA